MIFWKTFIKESENTDHIQDLISAIEFQLSNLLSSEAPLLTIAPQFREVRLSNYCYGLDNFQTLSSQSEDTVISHQLEYWIKVFEPRLENIQVEMLGREETHNRIRFNVQATLVGESSIETLTFDSKINLTNQKAFLKEQEIV